eukprot:COSAG02_NODE_379_length_23528_cov_140.781510_12_plen_1640_part_00
MAQQAAQTAAGGGATAEVARRRTREMSPEMRARALEEMSKNLLFNSIREAERLRIVDSMFDVEKHAGEDVITQGADGDNFYIIDRGVLEVFLQGVQGPVKRYDNVGSFGELALMYSQPRAATVRAAGDCLLWAMSRHTYQHMMRESEQAKRSEIQGFLERVSLFDSLQDEAGSHQLASLTDLCIDDGAQRTYVAGDCICKQGEEGDEFFILKSGAAQAHVTGKGKVRDYQAGDYFGEKALMNDSGRRAATIVATSAAQCLVVPGREFKNLLGSLDVELARRQQEYDQALNSDAASAPRAAGGMPLQLTDSNDMQRMQSRTADTAVIGDNSPTVSWAAPPASDEEQPGAQDTVAPLPDPAPSTYQRRGRRTSVSAEVFNSMAQQAAQTAAGGGATAEVARRRTREMSPEMRARALEEMSKNLLFNSIREAERLRIVDSMFDVEKHAGEDVITQGADGDNFYIIDRGVLEVFLQGVQGPVKRYDNVGSFGELALMYSQPRAATVRAAGDCLLWAMSRHTYQHMMRESEQAKRSEIQGFLERVSLFDSLQDEAGSHQLASLTDLCIDDGAQRTYVAGDCICKQGEEGDEFFILKSGAAQAHVTGKGKVRDYQAGDYFGEKALMNDSGRRAATIVATSAAQCLVVPGREFKNLLGSLDVELARRQQEYDQALNSDAASAPRAAGGMPLHQGDRAGLQGNSVELRAIGHQHHQISEADIAIAELFETGLILKMMGARASNATAASDEAFLFQLAGLRNQLVLRWSDIRSRKAVGCVSLARIAQIDFDRQRLEVILSSGRHVPIVLVASREVDFQTLRRALQHLHSGDTANESTESAAQESKRNMAGLDREIAALESELQADDVTQQATGSTTQAVYFGGNRVNQWGELTGDANMPTQRAPAVDATVRPGSEDVVETLTGISDREAAAAIARAEGQAANAVAKAEAEIAAAKANAEAATAAARADAEAAITKAKEEADSAEAESAFALVIARAEAEAAGAEASAEAEATAARARAQLESEIAIARARAEAEAEAIIVRAKAEAEATTIRARAEAEAAQAAAKARADAAAATAQSEAAAAARSQIEAAQALADARAARDKAAQADAARIEAARMEAEMSKSAQIEASRVEVAKVEAAQMQAHFARAQQEAAEVRAQMEAQQLALENHKAELEGQRRAIMEEEQAAIQRAKAASDAHIREQLKRHESEVVRQRESLLAEKKKVAAELRAAQEASYLQAAALEPEPEAQVARSSGAYEATVDRMPEAVQRALIRVIADAIGQRRSVFGVQCRDIRSFFSAVDRDGNGWLSLEELQDAMSRLDMGLVDEQLRRLVRTIDTDSDGQVTFSEFEKWMMSQSQEDIELQAQRDESRLQWQAERQLDAASTSSIEGPDSAPSSAPSSVQDDASWPDQYSDERSTAGVQQDSTLVSEAVPYASTRHPDAALSLDGARPKDVTRTTRRAPNATRRGPRRRTLHLVRGQGLFELLDREDPEECQWFVSPDGSDKSDGRQPEQSVDGKKGPFATFKRCRRVIDSTRDQRRHVIYISAGNSEWERYVVGMSAPLHANIAGFLHQSLMHCPPEVKDATLGQLIHRGVRTVHDLVAGPQRIHSAEELVQMGLPTCAQKDLWQAIENISHTQQVSTFYVIA